MPNDISEAGKPLMEAGFQWMAPVASIGQPVAAPAMPSFTGLTLRIATPCPIAGDEKANIASSKHPTASKTVAGRAATDNGISFSQRAYDLGTAKHP